MFRLYKQSCCRMSLNKLHFFQYHSSNAIDANDANAATVTLTTPRGILKTTTTSTECKNMSTDLCLWIIWLLSKCHFIKAITNLLSEWVRLFELDVTCSIHMYFILSERLLLKWVLELFWLFNPPQRLASEVYILPLDLSLENWPHSFFPFLPDKNGF